ncbi:hypothetical protein THIOKS12640015 [Thiocapsa sp. KS1]|nr:hypothetical protein THIOKS12640015 [Thiocapsa sp. KS1]
MSTPIGDNNGEGFQLELFGLGPPQLGAIFVKPCDGNVKEILKAVSSKEARAILDIRETPFLNFGDMSRESFFSWLEKEDASYVNVHVWRRRAKADTVADFFCGCERPQEVGDLLKTVFEYGSFVVFSDQDPRVDPSVTALQFAMKKSNPELGVSYID